MNRRTLLRTLGALGSGAALAGCLGDGGVLEAGEPNSDAVFRGVSGVTESGIDAARLARAAREKIESGSYALEWVTDGENRGESFFVVRHDSENRRLHIQNREGGVQFAAYYTASTAYRNDAPSAADPAHDQYTTPRRSFESVVDSMPRALFRLVRAWLSGYDYQSPTETADGLRLAIDGGESLVPYRLANATGHLLVSNGGVPKELSVEGIPLAEGADGEDAALDTGMSISLIFEWEGVTVTEPDWVDYARDRTAAGESSRSSMPPTANTGVTDEGTTAIR